MKPQQQNLSQEVKGAKQTKRGSATSKKNMQNEDQEMMEGIEDQKNSLPEKNQDPNGTFRALKQVQEEYSKFTQLRQRGHSQSVIAVGDISMTNPGTEVYIVDMRWIEQWKMISNTLANNLGGIAAIGSLSKINNQTSQLQIKNQQSMHFEDSQNRSDVYVPYFTNERIIQNQNDFLICGDPCSPFNIILKEDLTPGKDYQIISKDQWQILSQNYTRPEICPVFPIKRFYEKMGLGIRTFQDITYSPFDVYILGPGEYKREINVMYFSKKKTWDEFKKRALKIIKENPKFSGIIGRDNQSKESLKLWLTTQDQLGLIEQESSSVQIKGYLLEQFFNHKIDLLITGKKAKNVENNEKDVIIIELGPKFTLQSSESENLEILGQCHNCFKIKTLTVYCKCMSASYCSKQCQANDSKYHQVKCSAIDTIDDWDLNCIKTEDAMMGLTGLKNLKNSCYMSSSIQCLSHAIGLTNYFLRGHFKNELNYNNPLGAKGQLAIAYGKLLKQLWYDDQPSLAPWQFKQTIARFASNFNNYDQQDSQELLNFMLDGLHEDLNRVQKKPIVPQIESEGLNDEKDAEDSWQNHLKRNQSIIVDLMHGQFKSTVKCPDCEKLSITFDPFMSVSLPIPEIKIVEKNFYWVPYDTSKKCVQDNFKFKSLEQIKTLRKYIATSYDVHQEQFELIIIQDDQVKRILPRYEQISSLNVNNIFIFAMETPLNAFQMQQLNSKTLLRDQSSISEQIPTIGDQWSEKKGANELSKKLKQNYIQVILNFQIFNQQSGSEDSEKYFPRVVYLKLDETLIQAHLDIFEYLKPLFKIYLDHKEGVSSSSHKIFKKRKNVSIPDRIKTQLWDNMTQTQQYEAVFGPNDPSRRKMEDLPYLISILTRQDFTIDRERCVFCQREQCTNCPLPFEEMTLRDYLNLHGVSTQSYFYYEDHQHKQLIASSNKIDKKKTSQTGSSNFVANTPSKRNQANNLEFELHISFNSKQCWALYENLIRSKKYIKVYPERAAERQNLHLFQNDKVTIDDCFRQFMTPEKLSHQNTWFCSRCKMHKQAVKKFQVFRTPPILVINLKRFKGMQQKQNTLVHFPISGLDMSNFVISQRQRECEPLIYDLFGVSNHYGQLQGGHYTAYAKNHGEWYRFNDDVVEEIENESCIVSNAAYNLFYARRDIDFNNLDYNAIKNVLRSSNQNTQNDLLPAGQHLITIEHQNQQSHNLLRFEDDFEMSIEVSLQQPHQEENLQEDVQLEDQASDHQNNPNEASAKNHEQLYSSSEQNPPNSQPSTSRSRQKHWRQKNGDRVTDKSDSAIIVVLKPKKSRSRSRSPSQPSS